MTDKELKQLKDKLWHSADVLRSGAHLAANKYGQPILGLIFLRYADILYKKHRGEIEAEYQRLAGSRMEKTRKEIAIAKCGFYLPECAYYDDINEAPDTAEKAELVKKAMEAIEKENPRMEGVLPKEVYAQLVPEEEPELLSNIVRIFKDIPEDCTIDIFGEIYEYFLGNFALAEGKDGGTFYTPASVVRYMVEVLDPQPGDKKILDPACGSGGMFVQAARYIHRHNASAAEQMKFRCYGVEKEPDTIKLAKMNLMLNNVRGDITEANSYYSDPYNAVGQFEYVMANPPFNVDEVSFERVNGDARFNTYGVPRNAKKKKKKASDKDCAECQLPVDWLFCHRHERARQGSAGDGELRLRRRQERIPDPPEADRGGHHQPDGDAPFQHVLLRHAAGHAVVLRQAQVPDGQKG